MKTKPERAKSFTIRFSEKEMRIAKRRAYERSDDFKECYR